VVSAALREAKGGPRWAQVEFISVGSLGFTERTAVDEVAKQAFCNGFRACSATTVLAVPLRGVGGFGSVGNKRLLLFPTRKVLAATKGLGLAFSPAQRLGGFSARPTRMLYPKDILVFERMYADS